MLVLTDKLSDLYHYCGLEEQDDTQWVIYSTLQYAKKTTTYFAAFRPHQEYYDCCGNYNAVVFHYY